MGLEAVFGFGCSLSHGEGLGMVVVMVTFVECDLELH